MITQDTKGIVVFYSAIRYNKSIIEVGRTPILPFPMALDVYAETPNPASQLLQFDTEEERVRKEAELQANVKDPKWLEQLFDSI